MSDPLGIQTLAKGSDDQNDKSCCARFCHSIQKWFSRCWQSCRDCLADECAVGEIQRYHMQDGNVYRTPVYDEGTTRPLVYDRERSPKRRYDVPSPSDTRLSQPFIHQKIGTFPTDSRARFYEQGVYHAGTVIWTGYQASEKRSSGMRIVVRLDIPHEAACYGVFEGQLLIPTRCPTKRIMMRRPEELEPIPEILMGDYCFVDKGTGEEVVTEMMWRHGGFVRKKNRNFYTLEPIDTNYGDAGPVNFNMIPDLNLRRTVPPVCNEVSDYIPPISGRQFDLFLGRNKGIQGRQNSCYLDTLLFSFFAFSDLLDHVLCKDDDKESSAYMEVLNALRYQIIFPLRACHFVSYQHVEHLRHLIANRTGNESFRTDTRDIPECMDALFGQMLQIQPMLSIGRVMKNQTFFDGAYTTESLPMDDVRIPTSKQLLEHASVKMDFCFEEMPNCFMLQLPRQSNHNALMLPSYRLDLKNLIYRNVKVCHLCKSNATLQFGHIISSGDLASTFFCHECAQNQQLDLELATILPEPHMDTVVEEDTDVTIAALICIERSHYNCFVRCGSGATERWVFFDSMYDQQSLENPVARQHEVVNIPLVEEVPNFKIWLEEAPLHIEENGNLDSLFDQLTHQELERAKRIFFCPYNIIYRSNRT